MSLASGSTAERSRHQWRGVVEDFVDLNLNEHSYQCILKHTENLKKKLKRTEDADDMVRKGVIPPLVAILGHSDPRLGAAVPVATLHRRAVKILVLICRHFLDTKPFHLLVQAGAMPHLLKLLKQETVTLGPDIISLMVDIVDYEIEGTIQSQQEYMEALIKYAVCRKQALKGTTLRMIQNALSTAMPPEKEICEYLSELSCLLFHDHAHLVQETLNIYTYVANNGSINIIESMILTDWSPLTSNIREKALVNTSFKECARKMHEFLSVLHRRCQNNIEGQ